MTSERAVTKILNVAYFHPSLTWNGLLLDLDLSQNLSFGSLDTEESWDPGHNKQLMDHKIQLFCFEHFQNWVSTH